MNVVYGPTRRIYIITVFDKHDLLLIRTQFFSIIYPFGKIKPDSWANPNALTYCGLATTYGDKDLDQN